MEKKYFRMFLEEGLRSRNLSIRKWAVECGLENHLHRNGEAYLSKVLNGKITPSRDRVILLGQGLGLRWDRINYLLLFAGYQPLGLLDDFWEKLGITSEEEKEAFIRDSVKDALAGRPLEFDLCG